MKDFLDVNGPWDEYLKFSLEEMAVSEVSESVRKRRSRSPDPW